VPSLLRGFSAPVKLSFNYTREQLSFLVANDTDGFNRWNASQQLGVSVFKDLIADYQAERELKLDEVLLGAYDAVLQACLNDGGAEVDKAMVAQLLTLPTEAYISEISTLIDVDAIHGVREFLRKSLAHPLQQLLSALYNENVESGEYNVSAASIAQRSLKNTCLGYLMCLDEKEWLNVCANQFSDANNMTDMNAALRLLVNSAMPEAVSVKADALGQFYTDWQDEPLVIDQWFTIQASCLLPGAIDRVVKLQEHPAFDIRNPNKVRSLIAVFCSANAVNFHQPDGSGYEFLGEKILQLDELNPQIASRLLTPMTRWRKYDEQRQKLMKQQLQKIRSQQGLSKDVFEIVDKSLR